MSSIVHLHIYVINLKHLKYIMFRPTAIIARQREVKYTTMDTSDCPTVPDGCIATQNGRPQRYDGRRGVLSIGPDVVKGRQDSKRVGRLE